MTITPERYLVSYHDVNIRSMCLPALLSYVLEQNPAEIMTTNSSKFILKLSELDKI